MTDRTQEAPRAWKPLLLAGFGLLLVLLSAGLFAAVPGALVDERAYAAATACPTGTRSDSCTTTVPAIVAGTEHEPGFREAPDKHWLLLTERGSDTVRRVLMSGPEPVFDAVRAGDKVTLTYWRGEIRIVRSGAAAQETWGSPTDDWRNFVAFGLLALPFGLGVLWTGWWYRYRYPSAAHVGAWQLAVGLVAGAALGCVGFVGGLAGGGVRDAFLITAVGIPPVACLAAVCAWWLLRRATRAADTSDIVPVPPRGNGACARPYAETSPTAWTASTTWWWGTGVRRPHRTPTGTLPAGHFRRR
ncbi:hypothetical protein [Streptomyces vastus]